MNEIIKVFAGTSIGKRKYQQDCFVCGNIVSSHMPASCFHHKEYNGEELPMLFAVCDGMGGMDGGEIASSTCAELLYSEFINNYNEKADPEIFLKNTIDLIDKSIITRLSEMNMVGGTTIAVLLLYKGEFYFMNIGDSRAFLCKGCDSIEEISLPHNLAQYRMEQGLFPSEEDKKILLHSLGDGNSRVSASEIVHLYKGIFAPGDALILSSDGITDSISLRRLLGAAAKRKLEKAGQRLVEMAATADNADNSTLIIIKNVKERKLWNRRKKIW